MRRILLGAFYQVLGQAVAERPFKVKGTYVLRMHRCVNLNIICSGSSQEITSIHLQALTFLQRGQSVCLPESRLLPL